MPTICNGKSYNLSCALCFRCGSTFESTWRSIPQSNRIQSLVCFWLILQNQTKAIRIAPHILPYLYVENCFRRLAFKSAAREWQRRQKKKWKSIRMHSANKYYNNSKSMELMVYSVVVLLLYWRWFAFHRVSDEQTFWRKCTQYSITVAAVAVATTTKTIRSIEVIDLHIAPYFQSSSVIAIRRRPWKNVCSRVFVWAKQANGRKRVKCCTIRPFGPIRVENSSE